MNIPDEWVEMAAKAIFSVSKNFGRTWDDAPVQWREICVRDARAAITAIAPAIAKAERDRDIEVIRGIVSNPLFDVNNSAVQRVTGYIIECIHARGEQE